MAVDAGTAIAALSLIAAFGWGFANYKRNNKTDTQAEVTQIAEMATEIKHIYKTITKVEVNMQRYDEKITDHDIRIHDIEKSISALHERMDGKRGVRD